MSDYEKNMKSDLDTSISKNFADMNLNKYYVEQFNEKNIAEQSVLSDIFYNWEVANGTPIIKFDEETEISSTLKPKQYELIKLIFDSLESYKDPDKLREFRNCIARLNLIINTNEVKA
jgi:ribosomal protein L29